jgi:hypothetical protein
MQESMATMSTITTPIKRKKQATNVISFQLTVKISILKDATNEKISLSKTSPLHAIIAKILDLDAESVSASTHSYGRLIYLYHKVWQSSHVTNALDLNYDVFLPFPDDKSIDEIEHEASIIYQSYVNRYEKLVGSLSSKLIDYNFSQLTRSDVDVEPSTILIRDMVFSDFYTIDVSELGFSTIIAGKYSRGINDIDAFSTPQRRSLAELSPFSSSSESLAGLETPRHKMDPIRLYTSPKSSHDIVFTKLAQSTSLSVVMFVVASLIWRFIAKRGQSLPSKAQADYIIPMSLPSSPADPQQHRRSSESNLSSPLLTLRRTPGSSGSGLGTNLMNSIRSGFLSARSNPSSPIILTQQNDIEAQGLPSRPNEHLVDVSSSIFDADQFAGFSLKIDVDNLAPACTWNEREEYAISLAAESPKKAAFRAMKLKNRKPIKAPPSPTRNTHYIEIGTSAAKSAMRRSITK